MDANPPSRPILRRFLRQYAVPFLPAYLVGAAALVATNWINVLVPDYVRRVIDAIGGSRPAAVWRGHLWVIAGLGAAVIVTRTLSRVLFFNPGRTIEYRLKNDYFRHLLRLPPEFFERYRIGELISRGTSDMMSVRAVIGYATLQLFNISLALVLALGRMVAIDAWLTVACVVPLVAGGFAMRAGIRALIQRYRRAQEQLARLSDTVMDSYAGISVIAAFGAHERLAQRFDADNDRFLRIFREMIWLRATVLPIVVVTGALASVILLGWGGHRVVAGEMTVGQMAAYAAYIGIAVGALQSSGWTINAIQRGLVSLRRVYEILDAPAAPEQEGPDVSLGEGRPVDAAARCLHYRFAGGGAGEAAREVLRAITFHVPPGGTLGVFGPTGAGKSTLVNLLARLLWPPAGTLFVAGRDVTEIPRRPLRRSVAVVAQTAFLFSRTVRENVAFSVLPEQIDDKRVVEALRLAAFDRDLEQLPQGLDTPVGERGFTLSGGQRQRLALARALYRDCELLLLDDVLSAVDHETEQRLVETIRRRAGKHTTLIVSHRISALRHADCILVLENGRITARGTHEELVAQGGLYAHTWAYQQLEGAQGEATDRLAALGEQPG